MVLSYVNVLVAGVSTFTALNLIQFVIDKVLTKITDKTENNFDDLIKDFVIKAFAYSKYVITLYVALIFVDLPTVVDWYISKVFYVSFIFIGLILGSSLINTIFKAYVIKLWEKNNLVQHLLPFINKAIIFFIWLIWVITILDNLGYDVSALIAWAWVWGLALALAAQKSVSNIFGTISILLNKPFKVWDFVNVDWFDGTVKDIGITYLVLVDKWGHQIYIPNERLISGSIQNYSERESRRADFAIGLIYDTTIEKVREGVKIIEDVLEGYVKDKKLTSYRVNFDNFGDFSLNINATYFSNEIAYNSFIKEKEEINLVIKQKFADSGIEMAFPTQELIIKNNATLS